MNIKSILFKTSSLLFSLLFFWVKLSNAQGLTTPCNGGDPDVDCPIDSGLAMLFIVAVIYTCMKIYKIKPADETSNSGN